MPLKGFDHSSKIWPWERDKIFNFERETEFYYDLYERNIVNVAKNFSLGLEMVDPLSIKSHVDERYGKTNDLTWFSPYFKDPYVIVSFKDRTKLAKDILDNGLYFPLIIDKSKKGNYCMREGSHKIYSTKRYKQVYGKWNKKYFSIVVKGDTSTQQLKDDEPAEPIYIPNEVFFGKINNINDIADVIKEGKLVINDNNARYKAVSFIERNLTSALDLQIQLSLFVTERIFAYNMMSKKRIPAKKHWNDETDFKIWKKEIFLR